MSDTLVSTWKTLYGPLLIAAAPKDDSSNERSFGRDRLEKSHEQARGRTDSVQDVRMLGGRPVSELLEALRAGEEDALATLYTELFGMLWSLAFVQTRSRDTAKDVVQDVFLWLWTRRETIKADTDIQVYLVVAVRNRARNIRRHHQVIDAVETAVNDETADAPAIGQHPPSSDAAVEAHEFYAAYRRALATLSERERVAALLRWEEGFTLEQLGDGFRKCC